MMPRRRRAPFPPRRDDAQRPCSHTPGEASIMEAGPRGEREGRMDSTRVSIEKSRFDAVIFDLDGVVTQTAAVHAAAWKRLFDAYLAEPPPARARARAARARTAGPAPPAVRPRGRLPPVRGRQAALRRRPRLPGLARHRAAHGRSVRPRRAGTVCGLGNGKNDFFNAEVREHGVRTFRPRSRSSTSCATRGSGRPHVVEQDTAMVLDVTGTTDLFEVRVDAWSPPRSASPASRTRRCTSRRRAGWECTRRAPSWWRTRSPASRPAGAAGSAS